MDRTMIYEAVLEAAPFVKHARDLLAGAMGDTALVVELLDRALVELDRMP